jgi:hypothetical protein
MHVATAASPREHPRTLAGAGISRCSSRRRTRWLVRGLCLAFLVLGVLGTGSAAHADSNTFLIAKVE